MFELKCNENVKELWHGVCREVIMSRLPEITKVCVYVCVCYVHSSLLNLYV